VKLWIDFATILFFSTLIKENNLKELYNQSKKLEKGLVLTIPNPFTCMDYLLLSCLQYFWDERSNILEGEKFNLPEVTPDYSVQTRFCGSHQ